MSRQNKIFTQHILGGVVSSSILSISSWIIILQVVPEGESRVADLEGAIAFIIFFFPISSWIGSCITARSILKLPGSVGKSFIGAWIGWGAVFLIGWVLRLGAFVPWVLWALFLVGVSSAAAIGYGWKQQTLSDEKYTEL